MSTDVKTDNDRFLDSFIPVQTSLYAYVRAAGCSPTDADDVLQELASKLWKHFEQYDASRPFVAWAIGFARNIIRDRRRYDKVRWNTLVSSEICEQVADEVAAAVEENHTAFEAEREHLESCLRDLPRNSVAIIRWKYLDRLPLADIAARIRKSYAAANMMLSRARLSLMDCIRLKMAHTSP